MLPSGIQHDRYLSPTEGDVGIVKSILGVSDGNYAAGGGLPGMM